MKIGLLEKLKERKREKKRNDLSQRVACIRDIYLIEVIGELWNELPERRELEYQDIVNRVKEKGYPEGCWHIFKDYEGKWRGEEVREDLERMHTRGFLYITQESPLKLLLTIKTGLVYESLYGEGSLKNHGQPNILSVSKDTDQGEVSFPDQ